MPGTLPPYAAEIRLDCHKASRGWSLYYRALDDEGKVVYAESAATEADARARCVIYLRENGLYRL